MDARWYVMDGEVRKGPLSPDQLLPALLDMPEPRLARVWREGMPDWERAGAVPEFAGKLPPRVPGPSLLPKAPQAPPSAPAIPSERSRRPAEPSAPTGAGGTRRPVAGIVVNVAAVGVLLWAVLMLVAGFSGTSRGSIAGTVGIAALLSAYAAALFKRHPRALPLAWVVVALFGLSTLLSGLVPLMILVWLGLLGFALYLRSHRDILAPPR